MCETMEHVELDRIRAAEPVWYLGYSDNTNFIFPLVTMCDTAAVYGPCAPAFGMEPWHANLHDVFGLLTGEKLFVESYGKWEKEGLKSAERPLEPYHCTEDTVLRLYGADGRLLPGAGAAPGEPGAPAGSISMKGRLLGGCLDILAMLCGTDLDHVREFEKRYEQDGILWFLEACDFSTMAIRRAMWQLEHAGWFETAAGFLIGRPWHFDEPMLGLDQYDAVMEIASRHRVPVVMDADLGHLPPTMPLIAGSLAKLHARGNHLRIDMKLV